MNIYLVSQYENLGYDTYSDFICYAETEDDARNTLPANHLKFGVNSTYHGWASKPENVNVTLLGYIDQEVDAEVILASFHAG